MYCVLRILNVRTTKLHAPIHALFHFEFLHNTLLRAEFDRPLSRSFLSVFSCLCSFVFCRPQIIFILKGRFSAWESHQNYRMNNVCCSNFSAHWHQFSVNFNSKIFCLSNNNSLLSWKVALKSLSRGATLWQLDLLEVLEHVLPLIQKASQFWSGLDKTSVLSSRVTHYPKLIM